MKNLFFKAAAAFTLAVYAPSALFAWDAARALGAQRNVVAGYVERAKVLESQDRWEEAYGQEISCGDLDWEAREENFWLCQLALQKSALCAELNEAAENFFYTDQDGNKTRIVPAEKIQDARAQWKAAAQKILEEYASGNLFEQAKEEFYFAEEKVCNQLMNALLYDHDSLKKASDQEAAFFVAQNLAEEIEGQSERAVLQLFDSLEKNAELCGAQNAAPKDMQKENWLGEFESQMQSLLAKWDIAEEEFLTARAEWEREAENLYASDSKKWQEAYNDLQERKKNWVEKIAAQIQRGELEWQKKFGALNEEISNYMESFQNALAMELEQKERVAQLQVESYEQSRAILKTAQNGVDNWYARWSEKYNGLYSYWKTEESEFGKYTSLSALTTQDLKNQVQAWRRSFVASFQNLFASSKLLVLYLAKESYPYCIPFMLEYNERESKIMSCNEFSSAKEIEEACGYVCAYRNFEEGADDKYWQSISNAAALWNAPQELYEWLDVFENFTARSKDCLALLGSQELLDFEICDELSCQKAKAQNLLDSWECRVKIAQAVCDYSWNKYSDIERSQKTKENLSEALERYNQAKDNYQRLCDLASGKKLMVEEARQNYLDALQSAQEAGNRLETERQKYDELFDEKSGILGGGFYADILALALRLKQLNVSEEEFESRLLDYAAKAQDAWSQEFSERVASIRDCIQNGSDGIDGGADQAEGAGLQAELLEARETLAVLGQSGGKSLSMKRVEEIGGVLEENLRSASADKGALLELLDDLKILDSQNAAALEAALLDGLEFDDEQKELLRALLGRCEREIESREAALLLLDGDAEKIHEFFGARPDYADIYDNFKAYSAALLREESQAAKRRTANVIETFDQTSLGAYFAALDEASVGLDAAAQKVLDLYKSALESQERQKGREACLNAQLKQIGCSNASVDEIDYCLEVFEDYFAQDKALCAQEFDQSVFEEINYSREKLLEEIQANIDKARNPYARVNQINALLEAQEKRVRSAQTEYEAALDFASGNSPQSSIGLYAAACGQYNDFLEECSRLYEGVKEARQNYRLAEEIYYYGQNEYFREQGMMRQALEEAKAKRDSFKAQLDALNAIEQGLPLQEMDEYKQSYVQYYKSLSLSHKYQMEIDAQKARVYKAEAAERKALSKIVHEACAEGGSYSIPAAAKDLVYVQERADGSLSFSINHSAACGNFQNEELLKKYFSDYCVVETDVYGNEFKCSRARKDAIEFFDSLGSKPYGITELALAAMNVKIKANPGMMDAWLSYGENPYDNSNYPIGSVPDVVHGVGVASLYAAGRLDVLNKAYGLVVATGGQEDIAKFILLADGIFCSNLCVKEIQQNALKACALDLPLGEVKSSAMAWQVSAAALFGAAAVLTPFAFVPGAGAVMGTLVSALMATASSFQSVAKKLFETANDISAVKFGCLQNLQRANDSYGRVFLDLSEARKTLAAERDRLNVLTVGDKNGGGDSMSWSEFSKSLDCLFELDSSRQLREYFNSLCDSAGGQKNLKDLFAQASKRRKIFCAKDALDEFEAILGERLSEKQERLDERLADLKGTLGFDQAGYYKTMLGFYANDVLKSLPVNLGDGMEDYQTQIAADYMELRSEALLYSLRNKLERKKSLFDCLSQEMQDQYSDWQQKNELVLQNAAREWSLAQARVEDGAAAWRQDFSARYKAADDEWKSGYSNFLEQKQKWIYGQYTGAQTDDPASALSQRSKAAALLDGSRQIDSYLESLCDSQKFDRLMDLCGNLEAFAKNDSYVPSLFLTQKADASVLKDLDASMTLRRQLQEAMQDSAAKCAAQACAMQFENALDEYLETLFEKNKSLETWELNMVGSSGYTVDPLIYRDAVVGSTFVSTKRERQWVHRYDYYFAQRPSLDINLQGYAGTASHYIMRKTEEAQKILQAWASRIFGSGNSSSEGEFDAHVGKAPTFVSKIDFTRSREDNVKQAGSGQMGLIMLDYQWNAIKNSQGYAELSKAVYDQKLFDPGVEGLTVPSLRDAAAVACEIIGSATPFVFAKYIDDAIFAASDLAMGFKSWDQVLNESLRQGVAAAASYGIGAFGTAVGSSFKNTYDALNSGAGGHLFDAAQKAVTGYANSAASGFANAIDFARGTIDWQQAADSWLGAGALANAAGTMLGGALNAASLVDGLNIDLNQKFFGADTVSSIAKMNSQIGSWTGALLGGMATGDISVNLAGINGVGFLEVGVKDGKFTAGYGRGGIDLSYGALSQVAKGAAAGSKIFDYKNSVEGNARLTAINRLSYFESEDEKKLAADLYDQKLDVEFAQGVGELGSKKDGGFLLDKNLLSDGKAGLATITGLLAIQNKAALQNANASAQSVSSGLSGKEAIEAMVYDAAVMDAIFASAKLDAAKDCQTASLAQLVEVYKVGGIEGVYALYAELEKGAQKSGQRITGLGQLLEQPFFQNTAENASVRLGFSKTKEEYNVEAKQHAVEKYVASCLKEAEMEKGRKNTDYDLKKVEAEARAKAEKEIVVGVANKKYGYDPEKYQPTLSNYGCTLATAAYIAYSITGKVATLAESNELLKANGVFKGEDGEQVNKIYAGGAYAKAVNVIAGGDFLQADANCSVAADIKDGNGKIIADNRQEIYDRVKSNSMSQNDVYFTHMRVNGSHSVLLDSIDFGDGNNYKTSSFTVMDPWQGGKYAPNSWADISRADFYKLTQAGKEVYALTRQNLREAASS